MTSAARKVLITGSAVSLLAALVVWLNRPSTDTKPVGEGASNEASSPAPVRQVIPPASEVAATPVAAREPKASQGTAPTPALELKLTDEVRSQLLDIATLGRKAFMSDEEKARRSRLLNDAGFLRQIAGILTSSSLDEATKRQQFQAIDALLEARASGDSVLAGELMKAVVSDAQIENASTPWALRENLAGVKAELLYQWTAREPAVADEVTSLLPGPASKKIWENVQASQAQNARESGRT